MFKIILKQVWFYNKKEYMDNEDDYNDYINNNDYNDEIPELVDDEILTVECSICGESVQLHRILSHMTLYHPTFLITMASLSMPTLSDDEVASWLYTNFMMENIDNIVNEEDTYEYYSDLCDRIGNHYVGVDRENMDNVAPATILDTGSDEKCPICLENIVENLYARKINICNHKYCGPCIETWLEKHKTCPVCKKDITQIASISMSDSCSDDPVLPGPSNSSVDEPSTSES